MTAAKIKLEENKEQAQRGHQKLCGSAFNLHPRAKNKRKYFTSKKELQVF